MEATPKKKLSLGVQIFIALALGIIAGFALTNQVSFANSYIKPFGTIFLNLVKWVVTPLVFFSIMAGVISMRDIRKVGSVGVATIVYYLCTTAVAIVIGLTLANVFKGVFPALQTSDLSYTAKDPVSFMDTLVGIFPSNFVKPFVDANMLQIIVASLLIGFSLLLVGAKKQIEFKFVETLNDVFLKAMELIIKLSPIGVFCLICPVVAENGPSILGPLVMVLLVAYLAYILHTVIVYSVAVKAGAGMSPLKFLKGMLPAMMMAFSSASSVGTLPLNMECAATLASIGTAGVPGAGMIMLAMVLQSVGLPMEGIALVAGIDRIFDMGRTTVNITGDASCAIIVSERERRKAAKKAASN